MRFKFKGEFLLTIIVILLITHLFMWHSKVHDQHGSTMVLF